MYNAFLMCRYEWSVGVSDSDLPEGIFDETTEKVWHDAANNTKWVFTLQRGTFVVFGIRMSQILCHPTYE